jgi:hypothetical protein
MPWAARLAASKVGLLQSTETSCRIQNKQKELELVIVVI